MRNTLLLLLATVACMAADPKKTPLSGPPSALDHKPPSLMPSSNATNAGTVVPPAITNQPIQLQSRPQPAGPSFADGVRLGVIVARRNQDVMDGDALLQYAIMIWNREAAVRQQQEQAQHATTN